MAPSRLVPRRAYRQPAPPNSEIADVLDERASDFDNLAIGVDQARRWWLDEADFLDARPLAALLKLLKNATVAAPAQCTVLPDRPDQCTHTTRRDIWAMA
jgi:hypothetical protein